MFSNCLERNLPAISDGHLLADSAGGGAKLLDLLDDVHALEHCGVKEGKG